LQAVGSPYPVYTDTARAIAPQNRLLASVESIQSNNSPNTSLSNDALRNSSAASRSLRGSLDRADDFLKVAADDLSRIGSALDEVDTLVSSVENNPSLSRVERGFITAQIQDYLDQIDEIATSSNYDGKNLLDSDQTIELQIGSGTSSGNRLNVELYASGTEGLATGLSAIDISDDAGVSNARDRVDAAQEALSNREISLQADRESIAGAADRSRVSEVAGNNILQAQLAATEPGDADQVRRGIIEAFQGYLGEISARLQDQTVTIGGISLPEPQPGPEPVTERDDPFAYDPNADPFGRDDGQYFAPTTGRNTTDPVPFSTFGGYDSNGGGTGIGGTLSGGGGADQSSAPRVSIEA